MVTSINILIEVTINYSHEIQNRIKNRKNLHFLLLNKYLSFTKKMN